MADGYRSIHRFRAPFVCGMQGLPTVVPVYYEITDFMSNKFNMTCIFVKFRPLMFALKLLAFSQDADM